MTENCPQSEPVHEPPGSITHVSYESGWRWYPESGVRARLFQALERRFPEYSFWIALRLGMRQAPHGFCGFIATRGDGSIIVSEDGLTWSKR